MKFLAALLVCVLSVSAGSACPPAVASSCVQQFYVPAVQQAQVVQQYVQPVQAQAVVQYAVPSVPLAAVVQKVYVQPAVVQYAAAPVVVQKAQVRAVEKARLKSVSGVGAGGVQQRGLFNFNRVR